MYIQQDATLHSLFYLETALHVSGGIITNHQEHKQLYLQHLVSVTPLPLPAAIVWQIPDAVDTVVCAPDDGWWYHPKHVEQFPDINKLCKVASCWIYIGICLFDMFRTTKCSSSGRYEHVVLGYSFIYPYKLSGWCQDVSEYQTHPTGLNLISTYLILLAILQVSTSKPRSTACHTFPLYGLSICPYTIHVFLASLQCILFVCPFLCTNVSRDSHFCRFCFLYVRKERNKLKTAVSWDVMPSNMADW